MKFLVEIPDEHIKADMILAEDFGHGNSPEELVRQLLYEYYEFVTEVSWDENKGSLELDYPEIKVIKVE